jgi:uncharacterized protein YbbC (DUF1343 family)
MNDMQLTSGSSLFGIALVTLACMGNSGTVASQDARVDTPASASAPAAEPERVRPGISVLLGDSVHLIAGKRVALLTNQSGIDEEGRSGIDLLHRPPEHARGARLVALFSPEHGIRGTEDRTNIASERDTRTGLLVHSLYGATVLPPPDSALRGVDVLVVDLQDLGARPWTYVASMVYALQAAAKNGVRAVVVDRPNPITGRHVEGPVLDSNRAYAGVHTAQRRARPTTIHPVPMRHGLTMGELARYYNATLNLGADLHVIPAAGWRRDQWFDETGLPWVRPSPNMPDLTSATLYPGTVVFEATNLSVGRGTPIAFQQVGAPWLNAERVVTMLNARQLPGVRFESTAFTPNQPTDQKFPGQRLAGIRLIITDRDRVEPVRTAATMVWAIGRVHPDSLRVREQGFDDLFGAPRVRQALLRGEDPDEVMSREQGRVEAFRRDVEPYLIYR